MGCKQTKTRSLNHTSATEALEGKIKCPRELYFAKSQPTSRLSGEEILNQLREEGIVPDRHRSGGVAFSVAVNGSAGTRGKPPRRLERMPVKCLYTSEERQIIADVARFDRFVEQVQKRALDRDIKRKTVLLEKERQNLMKKMRARQKLCEREKRLKQFAEEKASKEEEKAAKKKKGAARKNHKTEEMNSSLKK
ncbi:inner centromere protein-like [Haliotis asinina]|uniref:inner centromere protein-like n=1 Tax=Haliotis asinina TaxID=109174 RepID=UPI0035319DA9